MEQPTPEEMITSPDFSPEELGAKFWYGQYETLAKIVLELDEELKKLKNRTSQNSSQPPSQDNYKKKAIKIRPKYDHKGTTRNGFEIVDNQVTLTVCECPKCGYMVSEVPGAVVKKEQIAELVQKPVEVTKYKRTLHQCSSCGWQGRSQLPLGCKEGFSYGGLLSSLVGWGQPNLVKTEVFARNRAVHRQYLEGKITLEQMQARRPEIEAQFEQVLSNPPKKAWAHDSQKLTERF